MAILGSRKVEGGIWAGEEGKRQAIRQELE
jgi:hypothetical protein